MSFKLNVYLICVTRTVHTHGTHAPTHSTHGTHTHVRQLHIDLHDMITELREIALSTCDFTEIELSIVAFLF